jgi:hypothetical protein
MASIRQSEVPVQHIHHPVVAQPQRPPLFWGYTRFSTPPQAWGDSDRRQDTEAREQAGKLGLRYVDTYRDLGISAYHSRNRTNGALGRFLDDLRSPPSGDDNWPMPGDILWFENFDRMSRAKPQSSFKLFMEIVESGVILMVRDQKFTYDILDQDDWRWQQVLSELTRAHKESKWKSERLLSTYKANRERARKKQRAMVGNRCPAWLRPIMDPAPGQWPLYEFRPPDQPTQPSRKDQYRQAWEMVDRGVGSPTIADFFNMTGVPVLAHRVHGKPTQGWTAQLVRQLLRNPAAMGVYRQKKLVDEGRRRKAIDDCEDAEDYYPALVDRVLFDRVDAALKSRAGKAGKGPQGETYPNLFKGLLVCGSDHDHNFTIGYRSKEGLRYLRCDQSRHKNCPNTTSFQYERFERLVLGLTDNGMQEIFANLVPKPESDPRHRRLGELDATIVSREEQVSAAWTRWMAPDAAVSPTMRDRAEKQLEKMDAEIARYREEASTLRQELRVLAAHDDAGFRDRVRQAREQLATASGEELKAIRMRLAQEIRRRIERIVCRYDGMAAVRLRGSTGFTKIDVHLCQERGVMAIDILDADGSLKLRLHQSQWLAKVDVHLSEETGQACVDMFAKDGSVLTRFDGAGLALLESIQVQAA